MTEKGELTISGQDAHLRDSTSTGPLERPGSLAGDSIRSAASASSGAGLRETATAPALGGAAISRRSSRLGDTATTSVATPQTHQPGMPIGLLAALGTPFAKKPLYRSRKCKILCPIVTLLTLIVRLRSLVFLSDAPALRSPSSSPSTPFSTRLPSTR